MTTSASTGASSASNSPIRCLDAGYLPAVEAGVGASEVHVLEDAQRPARALGPVARKALVVDDDDLARLDVPQVLRADDVQPAGLAGDDVAALHFPDGRAAGSRAGRGRRRACPGRSWPPSTRLPSGASPSRTASPTERPCSSSLTAAAAIKVVSEVELNSKPSSASSSPRRGALTRFPLWATATFTSPTAVELGLGVLPGGATPWSSSGRGRGICARSRGPRAAWRSKTWETRPMSRMAVVRSPSETAMPGRLLPTVLQGVQAEVGALGEFAGQLARVDAEDPARLLRLAVAVAMLFVQEAHPPGLRSCPTPLPSSRL